MRVEHHRRKTMKRHLVGSLVAALTLIGSLIVIGPGSHVFANDAYSTSLPIPRTAIINGDSGDNTLEGGSAGDDISGFEGDDELRGRGGDDRLRGGEDEDVLKGGAGRDTLKGGDDDDVLEGGD